MKDKNRESVQPSLFRNLKDTTPANTTWKTIFHLLTNGSLHSATEEFRKLQTEGKEKEAQNLKGQLCAFSPAVHCAGGRRAEHITAYTGASLCDFDHLPIENLPRMRELLRKDPHVLLAYVTLSGKGLRVIFRVSTTDAESYHEAFRQGNEHFATLLGCEYDVKCKNSTRVSVLAHDTKAFFNPDAVPFIVIPKQPESKRAKGRPKNSYAATAEQVAEAIISSLESEGIGYIPGSHNDYISRCLYRMNRYGVSREDALKWALTRFYDYGEDQVYSILNSVYRLTDEHGTRSFAKENFSSKDEVPFATVTEIEEFLTSMGTYRINFISRKCEIRWHEGKSPFKEEFHMLNQKDGFEIITNRYINSLWRMMSRMNFRVRVTDINNILMSDFVPQYHPAHQYFSSLPAWDGVTDYIGALADTVHTTSAPDVFRECFRKWFVGMLPCTFTQLTNQVILALIGAQGIYKTTFFNRLLPPELRPYFQLKTNSDNLTKDDRLMLAQNILICLEEIDSLRPSELNQLKAMLTLETVKERAPYERQPEERLRIASFCATGNNLSFLNDPTGSRRWLPFEVVHIDSPYKFPINYAGIYSQALALWKQGFNFWFELDEIQQLNERNRQFEVPNLEEELIATYYRKPATLEKALFINTAQILERINGMIKHPLSAIKVGLVMKRLGFDSVRNKSGARGYWVIERSIDEIRNTSPDKLAGLSATEEESKPERTLFDKDEESDHTLPF